VDISLSKQSVLYNSRLILWNAEIFYAFSLAFAKLSILSFYWRMFKTSPIRNPIKILGACTMIWIILRVRTPASPRLSLALLTSVDFPCHLPLRARPRLLGQEY
jgi:hypothetical protein